MSDLPVVKMIWAQSLNRAIGKNNEIPWHIKEDFQFFKRMTDGCTVVMGKNTWISLPEKSRPLPGRRNIVLTRNPDSFEHEGAETFVSIEAALESVPAGETIWLIGGAAVYAAGLQYVSEIEVTHIGIEVEDADAFAPEIPTTEFALGAMSAWHESESGLPYKFTRYDRRPGLSEFFRFLEKTRSGEGDS